MTSTDEAASSAAVQIFVDVLTAYELHGDYAIDAIRALRSTLHGFVTLESGGAFRLPVDIDRSFERMVHGITMAFATWKEHQR